MILSAASLAIALVASPASDLVDVFNGVCALNVPNFVDRMEAAAAAMDWQPVEGDAAKLLGPSNPEAEAKLWLATFGELRTVVGYSIAADDTGARNVSCSVTAPYTPATGIAEILLQQNPSMVHRQELTEAGQRWQLWSLMLNDTLTQLMLTTMADETAEGVTIGLMVKD